MSRWVINNGQRDERWTIGDQWIGGCKMSINEHDVVTIIDTYSVKSPIVVVKEEAKSICEALNNGMTCNTGLKELLEHCYYNSNASKIPIMSFKGILKNILESHEEIYRVNPYFNVNNGALLLDISFTDKFHQKKEQVECGNDIQLISEILQIDYREIVYCDDGYYFIDTIKIGGIK